MNIDQRNINNTAAEGEIAIYYRQVAVKAPPLLCFFPLHRHVNSRSSASY